MRDGFGEQRRYDCPQMMTDASYLRTCSTDIWICLNILGKYTGPTCPSFRMAISKPAGCSSAWQSASRHLFGQCVAAPIAGQLGEFDAQLLRRLQPALMAAPRPSSQDINSNICPPELVCSCAGAAASLEPRDSEPSMTCGATSPCIVHAAKLQVTPQLRSGWTAEGKWTSAPGVDTTYTVKGCDASSGGKYRWSSGKSTISVSVWGKMTFTVGINDQARQGGTKTIKVSENAARVTFLCPTPTG